jgi:hypothetical protein
LKNLKGLFSVRKHGRISFWYLFGNMEESVVGGGVSVGTVSILARLGNMEESVVGLCSETWKSQFMWLVFVKKYGRISSWSLWKSAEE